VRLATHRGASDDAFHALLPIAAFSETAGTFVNIEGRAQSFQGAVRAPGEARPGWKVLRVIANELGLAGFSQESSTEVRDQALAGFLPGRLDNGTGRAPSFSPGAAAGGALERLPEVLAYGADALVRRATALQRTVQANVPAARASAATLASCGIAAGGRARLVQGDASVLLDVALDASLADGVVRLPAGSAASAGLGPIAGAIHMEKA